MGPEVLNRFIQKEEDFGEILLLTGHMSQFCQPIFLQVSPVGRYRRREVYFKDPYSFLMYGLDFHRDPNSALSKDFTMPYAYLNKFW